jgi:hypothetical protein
MIVVRLAGGLGNQMFQYAAGRRLAHRHKTDLKLDLSFLKGPQQGCTPRRYALHRLNISAGIATSREVSLLSGRGRTPIGTALVRFRNGLGLAARRPRVFRERHFHFDPALLAAPDDLYLEGYWQSERYFADVAEILREEFAVRSEPASYYAGLAETAGSTNSVSVHVRRGDYASDPATRGTHGICDGSYYRRCVDYVRERVADPRFFVFSDDPAWARENVRVDAGAVYVDGPVPENDCEDLRLMSLCRHNVIANSTFSWWGAWLNTNPARIVLTPARWFADDDLDTRDLIPDSWVRM